MKYKLLLMLLILIPGSILAQNIADMREQIIGIWRLDMERTGEVFETVESHISPKRINEFREFLLYYEVYQWTFRDDGSMSISFKASGRNFPTQNAKYELSLEDFTKKEEKWVGRAPVFNDWASQMDVVKITTKKGSRTIIRLTSKELIVMDEGTPLVFKRVENQSE